MAAPDSAYFLNTVNTYDSTVSLIIHRIAIPIDEATFLSRFRLDKIQRVILLDGVTEGWIGMCLVGSPNYQYHAAARLGCINEEPPGGRYIAFNDGGLNTLGFSDTVPDITQKSVSSFLIPPFSVVSAYYFSGSYGVQINPDGLGWIDIEFATIAAATSTNSTSTDIKDYVEWNQVVQVRTYHLNTEGKKISDTIKTVTVEAGSVVFAFSSTYASQATGSNTYYYTMPDLIGGKLFTSADGQIEAALGYYVGGGKWYNHIDDNGNKIIFGSGNAVAGQWPQGDPANSAAYAFEGYKSTVTDICTATLVSPQTIYLSHYDGKYYTNQNLTTFVTDGYYINEIAGTRDWIRIQSGVKTSEDTCGAS